MAETPKDYWMNPVDMTVGTINWEETLREFKQRVEEEATKPPPIPVHVVSLRTYKWLVEQGIIKPQTEDPSRGKQQGESRE